MKHIIFLVIIFFSTYYCKAETYYIDASEKLINFSSYCKTGRISVFVISQHACIPCDACKDHLRSQNYNMARVDLFFCTLTKDLYDLTSHNFENRASNKMWGYIEGCTSPPYIYIFGPAKNPVSIINGYFPKKIDFVIDNLLESIKYFKYELVDFNNSELSPVFLPIKINSTTTPKDKDLITAKNTIKNLENGLTKKGDSIKILRQHLAYFIEKNEGQNEYNSSENTGEENALFFVRDKKTLEPIKRAKIEIFYDCKAVKSEKDGHFNLYYPQPSLSLKIKIIKKGYKTKILDYDAVSPILMEKN